MNHRGPAASRHVPVLVDRVVELLAPALSRAGAVHVDGTLGMGGHAQAVLDTFPEAVVVGVDRDTEALDLAGERLAAYGPRLRRVHAAYDDIDAILDAVEDASGARTVDSSLFDLGVSSLQLDAGDRGFAYAQDAPLDMRMDQSSGSTAAEILATYSEVDIARILRVYGEERFAGRIARAVVARRTTAPVTTSGQLVQLLREVIPSHSQRTGGHPAKRTFQALLSYHSLEDRLTKTELVRQATVSLPPGLPVVPEELAPRFDLLTRGAEKASAAEMTANPRATSVRLRAAVRVRPERGMS